MNDTTGMDAMFRALVENSPDVIVRYDLHGRHIYANPAWVRLTGHDESEIRGRTMLELPTVSDPESYHRKLMAAAQGQEEETELAFESRSLGLRYIHTRFLPERDADGRVRGMFVVGRDITERKGNEQAIRDRLLAEQALSRLTEVAPGALFTFRRTVARSVAMPYASRKLVEVVGCWPDEVAEDAAPLLSLMHPDDVRPFLATAEASVDTLLPWHVEFRINHPVKGEVWIEWQAAPGRDGADVLWHGYMHDVSGRKRMEAELHEKSVFQETLLESLSDVGIQQMVIEDGRIVHVGNRALAHEFGFTDAAIEAHPPLEAILHPKDRDQVLDYHRRRLAGEPVPDTYELILTTLSGERREYEVAVAVVPGTHPPLVITIGKDISERKRMEAILAQREQEFRSLAESSPDSIMRYDHDGRIRYLNAGLLAYLGMELEDLIGKLPAEVWPDGRYADIDRAIVEAMVTEAPVTTEYSETDAAGEVSYNQILVVPECDVDGRMIGTIAFGRDITDLKRYAQSLQERAEMEQRQSQFFSVAPGFFFTLVHHPDGRFTMPFASPGIVDLFGVQAKEVEQDVAPLTALAHPDYIDVIFRTTEESERALTPYYLEYRIRHPQGQRWIEVRSLPQRDPDGGTRWQGFMLDITARKQAEISLQEALDLNAGVVNAMPDILFEMDRDGRYLNVWTQNPDLLAEQKTELLGKTIHEVLPDEIATLAMNAIHDADIHGYASGHILPIKQINGEIRWYEHSLGKKVGRSETEATFIVLSRDITERKDMEHRLAEAHAFTEHLLNTIPDPIFVKDSQYHWLLLNDACCSLLGHTRDELIGKSEHDIFPKEQAEVFFEKDEIAFATRKENVNEDWITDAQGMLRRIQTKRIVVDSADQDILIGVIRDITTLREAMDALYEKERRLAEAQRIGRMGSWQLDLRNNQLEWSDEIYRIFEIDKSHFAAKYEAFLDTIHPDDRAAVEYAYNESVMSGQPYAIDHRLLFVDGHVKHVRESCETYYDEYGVPVLSCGTVQDITEIKETQLMLERSQAELRRLAAHRGSVLEDERRLVAHEMHEELAQVLAALRMKVSQLRSAMRAVDSVAEPLIKDMLVMTEDAIRQIRQMVVTMRPTTLEIGIVPTLEWLVEDLVKATAIDCHLKTPQDEPKLNDTQVTLLFRLVQEALRNVVQHADAQRVDITLMDDGDYYMLSIEDDGRGISPEELNAPGFGIIGMREHASTMGGTFQIMSRQQGGVSLSIQFPRNFCGN